MYNYISEIVKNKIYISDLSCARDMDLLKKHNIKEILCLIKNPKHNIDKYKENDIIFHSVKMADSVDTELSEYFEYTNKIIDDAIKKKYSILVHCFAGISRAPSIVIGYLISKGQTFDEAFDLVKKQRDCVSPNIGFLWQLETYAEKNQ
uniref:Dual specificity phosphatase n=1 Tax=Mimivirus LCMiAC01 TaxID=2506608 RepID=A0A481YZ33_9VIRU|nr:MAG: dual specificity phosphatase [Mimivirus LCMiAC01]